MLNIENFSKTNELFDGHYKLIRPLSTDGATADVWLAIDTNTIDSQLDSGEEASGTSSSENSGMLVAIKIYRPKNALDVEGEQRFREEYKIVYECRHANLLQPTSFSIFEEIPYLVLPYCKYGSSEQLIGKKQSSDAIWKYILDVASGLHRLHTNEPPIIHQDIKPANVLIDNSKNFAITDFGISSKRGGAHGYYFNEENSGTLAYMAPERFQEGAEPIAQSDIWAFGATLCEILTGKVPFGEEGGKNQAANNTPMPQIPNVPSDIQRLIHACLSPEPGNRPSAAKIKEAAIAKQYPIKSKKWLYGVGAVILTIILSASFFVFNRPTPVEEVGMSDEEIFNCALQRMNSEDIDSLNLGVKQMDSLCNRNYIPALYQMAFTYGWYNDPISLRRKKLLGIEIFESGAEQYMPKLDKYNDKAIALFNRIVDLNDSTYSEINAQTTYRLACYYVMPNKIFKSNHEKGKTFLERSLKWATMANDTALSAKIKRGLSTFDNNE